MSCSTSLCQTGRGPWRLCVVLCQHQRHLQQRSNKRTKASTPMCSVKPENLTFRDRLSAGMALARCQGEPRRQSSRDVFWLRSELQSCRVGRFGEQTAAPLLQRSRPVLCVACKYRLSSCCTQSLPHHLIASHSISYSFFEGVRQTLPFAFQSQRRGLATERQTAPKASTSLFTFSYRPTRPTTRCIANANQATLWQHCSSQRQRSFQQPWRAFQ